ncbi:MAG: hypothetical protein ACRCVT_01480 [Leadbetterella sp.]
MIKSFSILLFIAIVLGACNPQMGGRNSGISSEKLSQYKSVSILPFKVEFSSEYKRQVRKGENSWEDQERIAGLDLQKNTFAEFTRRAVKKNWPMIPKNFTETNKNLSSNKIAIQTIYSLEKSSFRDILSTDCYLQGLAKMEYGSFNMRRGINLEIALYDTKTGELLWQDEIFEDISSRMDSPADLAQSGISRLIRYLPFRSSKNN